MTVIAIDNIALSIGTPASYYDEVMTTGGFGFWMLGELLGPSMRDSSGFERHGTVVGGVTLGGARGPFPHGGVAPILNGSTGYIDIGDQPALEFTTIFSIECVVKWTGGGDQYFVSKRLTTGGGWAVIGRNGTIVFYADTGAAAAILNLTTAATFNDGEYHHVVCTWDGTTGANGIKIYVDGALVQQGTAAAGTIGTNTARVLIGAADTGAGITGYLNGTIAGVSVYGTDLLAAEVAAHYAATQWTDITDDLRGPLSLQYGTVGTSPTDRLATPGTLDFDLDNSEYNSVQTLGYYSPNHADVRAGFASDIPVLFQVMYSGHPSTPFTKFWGRIGAIDPQPGEYQERLTRCIAHDFIQILSETDLREIEPQINQTEDDLIRAIFEALPPTVQPMSFDLDAGVDTIPYAFYDLGDGTKATTALNDVIISSWARGFVIGDGTLCFRNRHALNNPTIRATFDGDMLDLTSLSDKSHVYDVVRVKTYPIELGATDTEVLFSQPSVLSIQSGATLEISGEYSDPADRLSAIGGTDFQDPLVENTDYEANTAADGSGADISADIDIIASFYASGFRLLITNTNAGVAYLVNNSGTPLLHVRGRGIYALVPVTSTARNSARPKKPITIDLPFQDDPNIGQAIADLILSESEIIVNPMERMTFDPHKTTALMEAAMTLEPSHLVSISETVTGLDDAVAVIRSVHFTLEPGLILTAGFGISPIVVGNAFTLDEDELDDTAVGLAVA